MGERGSTTKLHNVHLRGLQTEVQKWGADENAWKWVRSASVQYGEVPTECLIMYLYVILSAVLKGDKIFGQQIYD